MDLLPFNWERQPHLGFWRASMLGWKVHISAVEVPGAMCDAQPQCRCHDGGQSGALGVMGLLPALPYSVRLIGQSPLLAEQEPAFSQGWGKSWGTSHTRVSLNLCLSGGDRFLSCWRLCLKVIHWKTAGQVGVWEPPFPGWFLASWLASWLFYSTVFLFCFTCPGRDVNKFNWWVGLKCFEVLGWKALCVHDVLQLLVWMSIFTSSFSVTKFTSLCSLLRQYFRLCIKMKKICFHI